jgi:dolichyl-diphosphooligosaccharide--protein glycosyltransferase
VVNFVLSFVQLRNVLTPTPEWWQTLTWLRRKTPEPLGDAAAWTRFTPAIRPGTFPYPPQAYGVVVWWDFGYWVEYIARRIPSSNGTQAGVAETARFYLESNAAAAMQTLDRLGARYVIVDPQVGGADRGTAFNAIAPWIGRNPLRYDQVFMDQGQEVRVYLPTYYRSMAFRLYIFEGQAGKAQGALYAIHTHEEQVRRSTYRVIDFKRRFATEQEARNFAHGPQEADFVIGGFESNKSCVPVDAVPGLRLAYSSGGPRAVKVFERVK